MQQVSDDVHAANGLGSLPPQKWGGWTPPTGCGSTHASTFAYNCPECSEPLLKGRWAGCSSTQVIRNNRTLGYQVVGWEYTPKTCADSTADHVKDCFQAGLCLSICCATSHGIFEGSRYRHLLQYNIHALPRKFRCLPSLACSKQAGTYIVSAMHLPVIPD